MNRIQYPPGHHGEHTCKPTCMRDLMGYQKTVALQLFRLVHVSSDYPAIQNRYPNLFTQKQPENSDQNEGFEALSDKVYKLKAKVQSVFAPFKSNTIASMAYEYLKGLVTTTPSQKLQPLAGLQENLEDFKREVERKIRESDPIMV